MPDTDRPPCGDDARTLRLGDVAELFAPREAASLRGTRLLLVEDDDSIRTTLSDLLVDEGLQVSTATNGREAMQALRAAAPPDVIILDLMMPVMDGWEFRVEQQADAILAGIPLIAMSADISAKARAIAADVYLRKPIDFIQLLDVIRDVIAKARRDRLATADRMAALGTLASGIAHEINNPLTYVMANLKTLTVELGAQQGSTAAGRRGELAELASEALEGAERIKRLIRQVQTVAFVPRDDQLDTVELRSMLHGALASTGGEVQRRARLELEVDVEAQVRCERGRVEQLFANLLLNAAQAIPEGDAAANEVRVVMRKLPHDRVAVEITDSGTGIPIEIHERIFQPFFTTRAVGQGTGLGLAISRAIVSAMGGEISFRPASRRGTTFRVELPTTALAADPRSRRRVQTPGAIPQPHESTDSGALAR
jgi:signal transduction histidine kinase